MKKLLNYPPVIQHASEPLTSGHKRALNELDKYKILVESVEDYAIFLLDPNGIILTWNKGAKRNKGYSASEIIGKHFSKFYQPIDIKSGKPKRELELALKLGKVEDEDWRVRKDGSKFWANVVITTLYDDNGNHIGFAKVTRNLTDRKQQEDTLRKANVQLRKQQAELESLNRSKDDFISLASHQLRTPATAIKQLLGMLAEGLYGDIPVQLQPIIQKAYDSNERQIGIVNSLLKVAQIDAGKVILKMVESDLVLLIHEVLEEFKDTLVDREQSVSIKAKNNTEYVAKIDPGYFRMVISNLIDNASKYTPRKGKIDIEIVISKNNLIICIRDNGVGMDVNDTEKLFNKFVRIPNSLSRDVGGSGLGLYWAKKVVKLHGGNLSVTSELGKGSNFIIELPR